MNEIQDVLPGFHAAAVAYLREQLPEVKQVESIEEFEHIRLIKTDTHGSIVSITYDVLCPELFPSVRARLLEKNFIKKHNVLHTGLTALRDSSKEIIVALGYYGNCLQIFLECHKEETLQKE